MKWVVIEPRQRRQELDNYHQCFSVMGKLTSLDMISEAKLSDWGIMLEHVKRWFEEWFGGTEGWVRPEVRIIEKATGILVDYANVEAVLEAIHRENWERSEARMRISSAAGEWTGGRGTGRPYRGRIRRGP